ncbi:MAG: hypothetical protein HN341_07055 [Verrucomicrobia bacterium]|jgi:hypothetical protein|nr:hypothetical protein [Verrucomicrobiota bacterium]
MKRMSVALVALIVTAIGVHAAVTSVNIVGYKETTLEAGKRIIMSAPLYDPSGDGTNTLIGIFGTDQLLQAVNQANADRVIVFDTVAGVYQAYAQYTDGHFYRANSAEEWDDSILADDDTIPAGSSFWVVHPASAPARDVSLLGEVLGGKSHTQDVALVTGYQLASSAYAAEIDIQEIAKIADGATAAINNANADRIVTWDAAAQAYQTYALYTDDVWYKANTAEEWDDSIAATGTIPVGGGFWYISKTDFTLTDACPYSGAY